MPHSCHRVPYLPALCPLARCLLVPCLQALCPPAHCQQVTCLQVHYLPVPCLRVHSLLAHCLRVPCLLGLFPLAHCLPVHFPPVLYLLDLCLLGRFPLALCPLGLCLLARCLLAPSPPAHWMHIPARRATACWASRWILTQRSRPSNATPMTFKRICTFASLDHMTSRRRSRSRSRSQVGFAEMSNRSRIRSRSFPDRRLGSGSLASLILTDSSRLHGTPAEVTQALGRSRRLSPDDPT